MATGSGLQVEVVNPARFQGSLILNENIPRRRHNTIQGSLNPLVGRAFPLLHALCCHGTLQHDLRRDQLGRTRISSILQ